MISVRATTVAGGLAFVLVSWGMLDSSKATLARQFGRVQRQDASLTLDHPADAATLTALARIPGVAATEPSIEIPASLGNAAYSTSLIGLRPGAVMHGFPRRLPANGALIVVALLARLPGLRALAHVDLGRVVRERADWSWTNHDLSRGGSRGEYLQYARVSDTPFSR